MNGPAIVLLGPPGSGKGTLAALLSRYLDLPVISTGELLRAEASSEAPLAAEVRATMVNGNLVSDGLVNRLLAARLAQRDCRDGFILDGYPRTRDQAVQFDELRIAARLSTPIALELQISPAAVMERLVARLQCPSCGRIYNLRFKPPADEDVCDNDGTFLTRRLDDSESTVRNRLRVYEQTSGPLLAYCRAWDYHKLDAEAEAEELLSAVEGIVFQVPVGAGR